MKIEAAPLPRSRLAPLLHENRSRAAPRSRLAPLLHENRNLAASSFAAGAAPA
ncbi:MAG: hypothetical protein JNL37_03375 [Thauera sp.]|nr:hypothetical protein [Thauera sp.]